MHGIILAGGKSTRMQANKSFEKIKGRTLIEIIVNILKPIFNDKIIIITNETELYGHLNVKGSTGIFSRQGAPGRHIYRPDGLPFFYNFSFLRYALCQRGSHRIYDRGKRRV